MFASHIFYINMLGYHIKWEKTRLSDLASTQPVVLLYVPQSSALSTRPLCSASNHDISAHSLWLNISDFSFLFFFCKSCTPPPPPSPRKKLPLLFPATASQSWASVKCPLFENLVGGSIPKQKDGCRYLAKATVYNKYTNTYPW